MPDQSQRETWVGYVMDVACVRKSPSDEFLGRASVHTTDCALMGHCIESGFAVVDDDVRLNFLEPAATTDVVRELLRTDAEKGVRRRVVRERDGQEMHTVAVQSADTGPEG